MSNADSHDSRDLPQPEPQPRSSQPGSPQRGASQLSVPAWRFWTPLLIQMALLVSVPAQSAYTYATGQDVVLQTRPVDPYDFLRGYSQTLSYDVSDLAMLKALPGGRQLFATEANKSFYVVLEEPEQPSGPRPNPWKPVSVSAERPDLSPNQVALKGETNQWGQIRYGLESYYMPEDRRNELNQAISGVQGQSQQAFVVEVKVDRRGNAVPVSLWIQEQNYRF